MIKDFSVEAEQHFLSLINDINREQRSDVTDMVGDSLISIGEKLGFLEAIKFIGGIDAYHKLVLDKNNTTAEKIRRIFQNVREIDRDAATELAGNLKKYSDPTQRYIQLLAAYIAPNVEPAGILAKTLLSLYGVLLIDHLVNPAFNNYQKGKYGGNQGAPKGRYTDPELQQIVRKYHPRYNDDQIRDYLTEMNEHGCGYVAISNTIFLEYVDREGDFERTFGFPMYKDGSLNYDSLVVDFYSWCKQPGEGLNASTMEQKWEQYCRAHGITVDVVKRTGITPQNYINESQNGQILVLMRPNYLENAAGHLVDNRDSGHAMTITGITSDGRFKVSTWGEDTYYVNPKYSYKFFDFLQVNYN